MQRKKIWLIPNTKEACDNLLLNLYATGLFNGDEDKSQTEIAGNDDSFIKNEIGRLKKCLGRATLF